MDNVFCSMFKLAAITPTSCRFCASQGNWIVTALIRPHPGPFPSDGRGNIAYRGRLRPHQPLLERKGVRVDRIWAAKLEAFDQDRLPFKLAHVFARIPWRLSVLLINRPAWHHAHGENRWLIGQVSRSAASSSGFEGWRGSRCDSPGIRPFLLDDHFREAPLEHVE